MTPPTPFSSSILARAQAASKMAAERAADAFAQAQAQAQEKLMPVEPRDLFPPVLRAKIALARSLLAVLNRAITDHQDVWETLRQNAPAGDVAFVEAYENRKKALNAIRLRAMKAFNALTLSNGYVASPNESTSSKWLRETLPVEVAEGLADLIASFVGVFPEGPLADVLDTTILAEVEERKTAAKTLQGLNAEGFGKQDPDPYLHEDLSSL